MNGQISAQARDPVIRNSPLFRDFSDLEYDAVAFYLEPQKIANGEIIVKEGSSGDEMFILVSGKISAWISQTMDESRHWMFEIMPGDFFGEMSVIAKEARSATLTARTDLELLVFRGIDFFRVIFEHPVIGAKMLKTIRKVQNSWLEQTSKHLNDLMRWGEAARRRAVSDDLTDLYNRRFLEEAANSRFSQGAVGQRKLSLMMMDLDKFHEVNEKFGQKAGDLVFKEVALVLRSSTRTEDICTRLSGDEFAVLLPDTGPQEALIIAERIRNSLASRKFSITFNPGKPETIEIDINVSIGIATAPLHADNWQNLFLAADRALHHAKEMGRNRVEIADEYIGGT